MNKESENGANLGTVADRIYPDGKAEGVFSV
jgi:hypothetical protein